MALVVAVVEALVERKLVEPGQLGAVVETVEERK